MDFDRLIEKRRSIRKYTAERISEENIEKIIRAGLLAPSSRNLKSAELIVIRTRETLERLADVKAVGSDMLRGADFAVAVIGDSERADAWIEDCSLALIYMQLAAAELGIGSCWIQCRLRNAKDGRTSEEFARDILAFPENYSLEAIMSFGVPAEEKTDCAETDNTKVHKEKF